MTVLTALTVFIKSIHANKQNNESEIERWETFIKESIVTSKTVPNVVCCLQMCNLFRIKFDNDSLDFQNKYLMLVAMADTKRRSIVAEEEKFLKETERKWQTLIS